MEQDRQERTAHGDAEAEETEDAKVKTLRDPGSPSKEEVDRHYVTHMPFRSRCPIWIQGKGKENPHYRKVEKSSEEKPTVAVD